MAGSDYIIGQVSNLLSGSTNLTSKKKKTKADKLLTLFSAPKASIPALTKVTNDKNNGFNPPPGIIHETLTSEKNQSTQKSKKRKLMETDQQREEKSEQPLTKRLRRDRRDKTNDNRTVFIGNLPTSISKKALKKLFSQFGEIETVRLRCAPRKDLKMPKKLSIIKKEFHPERHNIAGFIMFKNEEDSVKATKLNGTTLEGNHIRVDLASLNKQHDHKRSVFVGNLPFDAVEEDVRAHFQEYGEVESVRLVRDRNTSVGKGFGYVLFQDKSSVSLTLKFGKHKFKGRELRVARSTDHPIKPDKTRKTKDVKTKRVQSKGNNSSNRKSAFQGEKAMKKNKVKKPRHRNRDMVTTSTTENAAVKERKDAKNKNTFKKPRRAVIAISSEKRQHKRFE